FVKFCYKHIEGLRKDGRGRTADKHRVVRNSLVDFFVRTSFSINEIHTNMLLTFERYLKSERKLTRINQFGSPVTITSKGVSEATIHNYIRDLRTLFNAARNHYNNEDLGLIRIKHYPFKKYKVGSAPPTRKRNNKLEEVLAIRDCITTPGSRAELAKDLYMLSFYHCGMNAVDLYQLNPQDIRNKRIDY